MSGKTDVHRIGCTGENIAANMLVKKGFEIVCRNYHTRYGEIYIIARNEKYIVFAEVKTRHTMSKRSGVQAVTLTKQRRIILSALYWRKNNPTKLHPRFDVIVVDYDRRTNSLINIRHIEAAFDAQRYDIDGYDPYRNNSGGYGGYYY